MKNQLNDIAIDSRNAKRSANSGPSPKSPLRIFTNWPGWARSGNLDEWNRGERSSPLLSWQDCTGHRSLNHTVQWISFIHFEILGFRESVFSLAHFHFCSVAELALGARYLLQPAAFLWTLSGLNGFIVVEYFSTSRIAFCSVSLLNFCYNDSKLPVHTLFPCNFLSPVCIDPVHSPVAQDDVP